MIERWSTTDLWDYKIKLINILTHSELKKQINKNNPMLRLMNVFKSSSN